LIVGKNQHGKLWEPCAGRRVEHEDGILSGFQPFNRGPGFPIAGFGSQSNSERSRSILARCEERTVRQTRLIRPTFAERFQCIGSACEETCCQEWNVPIDQATYEKYQNLPDVPLRSLIQSSVKGPEAGAEAPKPATYGKIVMNAANKCPLLAADNLCRIHSECGEELLSHVCKTYPRIIDFVSNVEEKSLSLSCPEAARQVLLDPNLFQVDLSGAGQSSPYSTPGNPAGQSATDTDLRVASTAVPAGSPSKPGSLTEQQLAPGVSARQVKAPAGAKGIDLLLHYFWPIRETVLLLVRNRRYPMWQRLFMLGVFCRRMDAISRGELNRAIPDFLDDFAASVAVGGLTAAMDTLPVDREAQLDVVLQLAGMLLQRSNITPRFSQTVDAFTSGIGNGPAATLQSLTAQYSIAHDQYYAPFMAKNPHIMENYLINTIIRCIFPFGREAAKPDPTSTMTHQFAVLIAQFALMKGLMIGVAGHYRDALSNEHVVQTFQSASKHFEHHPEFLKQAFALLVETQMDGARGLAILTRNSVPGGTPGEVRPKAPAVQAPGIQSRRPA
jgi:lysine-N-methylase